MIRGNKKLKHKHKHKQNKHKQNNNNNKTKQKTKQNKTKQNKTNKTKRDPFKFVLSPGPTVASTALVPQLNLPNPKVGDTLEISPEVWNYSLKLADLIGKAGGACLMIDYGEDHVLRDSVRVS